MISLPIDNCKDSNTSTSSNTSKETYSLHSGIITSMKTVVIDEKKSPDEESDEESDDESDEMN